MENTPEKIAPPLMRKPSEERPPLEPVNSDPFVNTLSQKDEARFPPRDEPSKPIHRRIRRKKFAWKITGVTACSKTCGGG